MSTMTSNSIKCPNPVFESPRDVMEYLERVEASWLNSQAKGISDVINAPSAFANCGFLNMPATADYALDNAYKAVADANGTAAKKATDDMNKRLLTLLVEASKDHSLMNGWNSLINTTRGAC